jgi:hypothetical protein
VTLAASVLRFKNYDNNAPQVSFRGVLAGGRCRLWRTIMTKSELELLGAEWLSERVDSEEPEGLSAFRDWMRRRVGDDTGCLTVHDVVLSLWERLRREGRLH